MQRKKVYELTPEHRALLKPWADRWIANNLSTAPMTDTDRDAMRVAINGLHAAAKLPPPDRIVFAASPIGGAIAASVAAGVWYLRDNPGEHRKLFGRALTEGDLQGAIAPAVAFIVRHGMSWAREVKSLPEPPVVRRSDATIDATIDATRAATIDATRAATSDATIDATRDATIDATRAATIDATIDATRAATSAATLDATRAATIAATIAATGDATSDATRAATRAATSDATIDATRDATRAATSDATSDATRAATIAATIDATIAATRAATIAATIDATRAATIAATRAATRAATSDATIDATRAATIAATRAATIESDDLVVRFLVRCSFGWSNLWEGGNQWSGWVAYLSFFRYVAKLDLPEYEVFEHYEKATIHGGPRFMHRRFCIVSDRPTVVSKDDRNRPHREDGPFTAWRDGWELYAWHGTRVPADWINHKDKLDPKTALTHENIEQRRAAAEIVGWAKILEHVDARVVDTDDPEIGTLYEADLPDAPRSKFLRVTCGTKRQFVLPVPSEMRTALEANSWTYDVPQVDVRKLEERT